LFLLANLVSLEDENYKLGRSETARKSPPELYGVKVHETLFKIGNLKHVSHVVTIAYQHREFNVSGYILNCD
jgi:hypothetical protein